MDGFCNMAELDDLWTVADQALAKAVALPWGPERIEALKTAGHLRNEAAVAEISKGSFRKISSDKR